MGIVLQLQRCSVDDGPGIRTTVFLKGCPLRCLWCHNPESQCFQPQVMLSESGCLGCGRCVACCPQQCHSFDDSPMHRIDRTRCTGCGICAQQCQGTALTMAGQEMSAAQVMETVMQDKDYYRESGGGMTLSGGEPLCQPHFSLELLMLAKKAGIHTAVETCGHLSEQVFRTVAPYTDLFLFDYKATGDDAHIRLTGVSNQLILHNLSLLQELGSAVILRCPIIPGLNDTPEHFAGIAGIAKRFPELLAVELLAYHRMGVAKAAKIGEQQAAFTPPAAGEVEGWLRQLESLGVCHVRQG